MIVDETAPRTRGEDVFVPSHYANTGVVAVHASELGTLLHIPDLRLAGPKTHSNVRAIATPLDTADVGVRRRFKKAADSTCFSTPNVHIPFKSNG